MMITDFHHNIWLRKHYQFKINLILDPITVQSDLTIFKERGDIGISKDTTELQSKIDPVTMALLGGRDERQNQTGYKCC